MFFALEFDFWFILQGRLRRHPVVEQRLPPPPDRTLQLQLVASIRELPLPPDGVHVKTNTQGEKDINTPGPLPDPRMKV